MENEENKCLIHKNAQEDQLVTFFQFSFGALSLLSLSLSHTLGYLEFSWSTLGGCGILGFLEQEGKGRARKHKRASTSAATSDYLQVLSCMYYFFTSLCMHGACMCFLGYDLSLAMEDGRDWQWIA